ncbi:uncharacterized protein LOC135393932 [Ornithodoros turicata]
MPDKIKLCNPQDGGDSAIDVDACNTPSFTFQRQGSTNSLYYYASSRSQPKCQQSVDPSEGATTFATTQSQRIPTWLWILVAHCLLIPVPGESRLKYLPSLGMVLQAATILSAFSFCLSNMWYEVKAIIVNHDRQDAIHRCVSIFVIFAWCSFGLYGRRLARRLFSHTAFLRDIRMHSKTVFKINAAVLAILAGLVFVVASCYNGRNILDPKVCAAFSTPWGLCVARFVSRIIFSTFTLIWNGLVCVVVVSVCRTHTIGIRRFIRELERDAILYEMQNSHLYRGSPVTSEDICQESIWIDDGASDYEDVYRYSAQNNVEHRETHTSAGIEESGSSTADSSSSNRLDCTQSVEEPKGDDTQAVSPVRSSSPTVAKHHHVLTVPEILQRYWKISCRLRLTGIALQRWVASLVGLVVVWCSATLISWLKTSATVYEIIEFVSPLVILLLVCSCLAEVNMEGVRVLRCLRPTKDRLPMLNYLNKSPLQLVTFGFSMSYGTIMTVVLAIMVAFISRLIVVAIRGL